MRNNNPGRNSRTYFSIKWGLFNPGEPKDIRAVTITMAINKYIRESSGNIMGLYLSVFGRWVSSVVWFLDRLLSVASFYGSEIMKIGLS